MNLRTGNIADLPSERPNKGTRRPEGAGGLHSPYVLLNFLRCSYLENPRAALPCLNRAFGFLPDLLQGLVLLKS